jgi:N-acetylglucosaminyldiphosphoundecaprenol N-acetyl-beta-D-mannosaminyltransferase
MTSVAAEVLRNAAIEKMGIYLVGSENGVVEAAAGRLADAFPGLRIAGARSGFFSSEYERQLEIQAIVSKKPGMVIVGMGVPRQERFLIDLRDAGWIGMGYTCGGFLHQTARRGTEYYPRWIDRMNLRWLYRMIDEPRLIQRYFVLYPKFLVVFAWDVLRYYGARWIGQRRRD